MSNAIKNFKNSVLGANDLTPAMQDVLLDIGESYCDIQTTVIKNTSVDPYLTLGMEADAAVSAFQLNLKSDLNVAMETWKVERINSYLDRIDELGVDTVNYACDAILTLFNLYKKSK